MKCFDLSQFKNPQLAEEFRCPIGLGGLNDPVEDSCGHVFCRKCFEDQYVKVKICPVSKQPISEEIKPAVEIIDKIKELIIFCKHYKEDCKWEGKFNSMDTHLSSECPNETAVCDTEKCGETIKRNEMVQHKKVCEWIPKPCQFCEKVLNDIEMEEHHNSDCPEIVIDCEKKCILRYKRKNKGMHDKYSCEKTKYDCYFRNAGCYFNGTWEEAGRHSSEAFLLHASFLEQKLAHFEEYKKVTQKIIDKVKENKEKFSDLDPIVDELDATEDGDYPMFIGNFDNVHSDKRLIFEDARTVKSVAGNANQMLFFDRKFHERHRIVISLESYKPNGANSAFAWGLASVGYFIENGKTEFDASLKRKFVMFSDKVDVPLANSKGTIKIVEKECYMMSYDPDEYMLYLEQLNSEVENPETVKEEFPMEFHEWQPVIVLSGDVTVKLMDFNDWNQH